MGSATLVGVSLLAPDVRGVSLRPLPRGFGDEEEVVSRVSPQSLCRRRGEKQISRVLAGLSSLSKNFFSGERRHMVRFNLVASRMHVRGTVNS